MTSQIIPLLGIASQGYTPEPLRTITVNATFEGEQTTVYKEAVLMDSASTREALIQFPLRDGKHSSRTFAVSAIDDPDKNRVIMLYGSSPEDQAVVSKSLKITSDLNIMLDLSETGGGIVDYPLLTGVGKLSGFFDLSSLPDTVDYSQISIVANYRDPQEGVYNGLQAGKTTCEIDGSWIIEGLNEAHKYNVVMSIPTFNDITYSNKETSDSTYTPVGDPHWDKVVSLLHFDGDLTDETGRTWAYLGNVSFDPGVFGDAFSASSGGWAVCSDLTDVHFDSDYCIEAWVLPSTVSAQYAEISAKRQSGSVYAEFFIRLEGDRVGYGLTSGSTWFTRKSVATISAGVGFWIALVKDGTQLKLYLNGALDSFLTVPLTPTFTSEARLSPVSVGALSDGSEPFSGKIDELRITKGVARYTEDFTPPTEPFLNHLPR